MKPHRLPIVLALVALCLPVHAATAPDGELIQRITGLKGALNAKEGVFKVTVPRKDVPISVDGWAMPPFMGLTSWAAFSSGGKAEAMVMGDLVLFEDEVNPVLGALLEHGVGVTALHNHFFYAEPHVYFMHIDGEGSTEKLAAGVRAAFDTVAAVRRDHPQPSKNSGAAGLPGPSTISTAPLEELFGSKAQTNAGMAKFVFGRETTMDCGCPAGAEMGVNTWAAFAGADDNAVVDGDFAMKEDEVQDVLKTLHNGGIAVVALHHHMIGESPRIIFLHYWGRGKAQELASTLKRALAVTKN